MKKSIIAIFLLVLCIFVSACNREGLRIEDHHWILRTAIHTENEQLVVDALEEPDALHTEAAIVEITLEAANGKITIIDLTNEKTYEGTYTLDSRTPDGTNYKISIDGILGYATVAMTTYADGKEEPTLPIKLGDHSLYFYAE